MQCYGNTLCAKYANHVVRLSIYTIHLRVIPTTTISFSPRVKQCFIFFWEICPLILLTHIQQFSMFKKNIFLILYLYLQRLDDKRSDTPTVDERREPISSQVNIVLHLFDRFGRPSLSLFSHIDFFYNNYNL